MFQRNMWSVAMFVLALLLVWLRAGSPSVTDLVHDVRSVAVSLAQPREPPGARKFSPEEIHRFLAQASLADAVRDPLQRCLAYPDPPGSHWSPAAVKAYCQYSFQHLMTFADIKALVDAGRTKELDRSMQSLLQQQAQPGGYGLLDHTYLADFYTGSPGIMPTLEAWKRASPNSAFAFAASGVAYVKLASDARGDASYVATSGSQLGSMGDLLKLADADLEKAVSLDPRVSPAYVAMIKAGRLKFGRAYLYRAVEHGLAASPDDYGLLAALVFADRPQWGGSLASMQDVAAEAQKHATQYPMLTLLSAEAPGWQYDVCNCQRRAVWTAVPVVFDQLADVSLMQLTAYGARAHGHEDLSAVYLSEAIRFTPDPAELRMQRNDDVVRMGDLPWALADASSLVAAAPASAELVYARGLIHEQMRDVPHAVADFREASRLDPNDPWSLVELGRIDVHTTHDWDAGWSVANQLIQRHPELSQGWILRASIQKDQPRAGLDDTMHYFLDHFGNDPSLQAAASEMRAVLASEAAASARKKATLHG